MKYILEIHFGLIKKIFYFLIVFSVMPLMGQNAIQERFDKFVQSSSLMQAVVGFELLDLQTGQIIAAENNFKALTPASVLKLLTSATALELLGPQYRFETAVCISGEVTPGGTLEGNLHIVGGGDPTTGSSFFPGGRTFADKWLKELSAKGIKNITGRIYVDAGCYDDTPISTKWLVEDVGNYYAPGSYGVALFDNSYRLTLQCKAANEIPEIVYCTPDMKDYLTFANRLRKGNKNNLFIEGLPSDYNRILKGTVTNGTDSIYLKGDIPDVPRFMEYYMYRYFGQKGIEIIGEELPSETLSPIAVFDSPALSEIIKITNYKSINLFADHLLKQIGYESKRVAGAGSFQSGLDVQQNFWQSKGVDLSNYTLYDGSGLAPGNKVSANILNSILSYMNNESKNRQVFRQSLPQAGREGTVAGLVPNSYSRAAFFLKSGSMTGVRAYSGYIVKEGRYYAITLLCNNFSDKGSAVVAAITSLFVDLGGLL